MGVAAGGALGQEPRRRQGIVASAADPQGMTGARVGRAEVKARPRNHGRLCPAALHDRACHEPKSSSIAAASWERLISPTWVATTCPVGEMNTVVGMPMRP